MDASAKFDPGSCLCGCRMVEEKAEIAHNRDTQVSFWAQPAQAVHLERKFGFQK